MVVAQEARAARIGARGAGARRQCGRRRGRHRLCDGGDLSARRQYRRRRLHGHPPRRASARPERGPRNIAIDYRETAPAAATRDMFLDEKGNADPQKSRDSALAIGVPGTVAGLALAHQRYGSGRLTLAELIAPAIALARDGFAVEDDIADSLPRARTRLGALAGIGQDFPEARRQRAGAGRPAGPARPRRHARSDREARPARVLRRPDRREARRRGAGRRRHHDRGRPQELSAACAAAGARALSRPRDHLDAAVVVRRRGADRDAQHARGLQAQRAGRRLAPAPDDRGDAARLCRPRRLSRRSGGGDRRRWRG